MKGGKYMILEELRKIEKLHSELKDLHPSLSKLYPVAITEPIENNLHIYDLAPSGNYEYITEEIADFPLPDKIRAAFPLEFYEYKKSCCVVSEDIFVEEDSFVTFFHEFVHCYQFETCEQKIRSSLYIIKEYDSPMWEINHPFPYEEDFFVNAFGQIENAVKINDPTKIVEVFQSLKSRLKQIDYEYLIWQMWKEGFARFVENCIREKYQLSKNTYGSQLPYNRISLYYLGDLLISHLNKRNKRVVEDIEELYKVLYDCYFGEGG